MISVKNKVELTNKKLTEMNETSIVSIGYTGAMNTALRAIAYTSMSYDLQPIHNNIIIRMRKETESLYSINGWYQLWKPSK